MAGFNSLRDNPITNFILGSGAGNQPGVGAYGSGNPSALVRDPQTGLYFDPTTGNTYTDPQGNQPVADPNVSQQVAANFARSSGFLNNLSTFDAAQKDTIAGQGALEQVLRDRVAGKGASLAGMQLQAGQDNIARQELAQSAGVSGAGAPLAQLAAMRNTGSASIAANNAAAVARVKEEQDAANALSNLLAQRANAANTGLQTNIGASTNFANLAMSGQSGQQGLDAAAAAARAASAEKFGYALLKGVSSGTPVGTKNPVLGDSNSGDSANSTSSSGDSAGGGVDNLGQGAAAYAAFA